MKKKNSKKNNFEFPDGNKTEIPDKGTYGQNSFPKPAPEEREPDIPEKEVYIFFGTILVLFTISFLLKYIFPHVPEYIFERLLLIVLAAFCGCTLWKLSPGLREFTYRHIQKFRRKE